MATLIKLLPLIIKYWPIIRLVLAMIRGSAPLLKELADRPETGPAEDAREFMRNAGARGRWQDELWRRIEEESG